MMRFRRPVFALVLLAAIFGLSLHAQTRFAVGTASAAPSQKATGYLEVPAGIDAGTNISVVMYRRSLPGPSGL